jgi:IMP dehydrogenase
VVDESKKIVGLMTRNNFDLCGNRQKKITDVMSKNIISAEEGTTVAMAYEEMIKHSVKTLPIFDKNGDFKGIYTWADVDRIVGDGSRNSDYNYNLDANGNLIVGAAIGVYDDAAERMELLSRSKVDVVAIDTAHGNSKAVVETIEYCKKNYPHIDVVAGNISEPDGARRLVRAGADGVKVGQGPGSICTTRIVTGIGCPQVEAVYACSKAIRGSGVPVCADGGIEYSGDIPILIGAGAHTVMLGKLLAGTKESPGDVIIENGKRYKVYRGMGSPEAMEASQASRERYGQGETEGRKTIAEGISGKVEYKGEVGPIIYQLLGGTKSGFAYLGAKNVAIFQRRVTFHFVTGSGMEESHPHGLNSKNTAPNYQG